MTDQITRHADVKQEWYDMEGVRRLVESYLSSPRPVYEFLHHHLNLAFEKGQQVGMPESENIRLRGVVNVLANKLAQYNGTTVPGEIRDAEQTVESGKE